ncbi:hypothetical protein GAY29_20280 [Azospirillum brasilense]|uniref:hypothetical protein n=1 Tax=Azospirillum brasilense TaxID=192 RepID=UPI00190CC365|nr:hypothetical protein [Azospirillum brasilense]MBK3735400.1 hypothetical protein [Azospirillum brasilense]
MSINPSNAPASGLSLGFSLKAALTVLGADKGAPSQTAAGQAASASGGSAVFVTLSVEAQAFMATTTASKAGKTGNGTSAGPYAAYFPTRDGKNATALAKAVSDPGAVSSSAGLSGSAIAKDARTRMDAQYAAMKASGKPFDFDSFEGRDWYSLMGDLDRRSLEAVRSNAGGNFSKQEQDIAQSIMAQQEGLAMGLYNGPISQEASFTDPFRGDEAARMKANLTFLDAVGPEEKTSTEWATRRASAQVSYEIHTREKGDEPEKLDSDNPLATLIKQAMDRSQSDPLRHILKTPDALKTQAWFKGFESRLDTTVAQNMAQGIAQGMALAKATTPAADSAEPA